MDNGYFDNSLSSGLSDCHGSCWRNCSCIAFLMDNANIGEKGQSVSLMIASPASNK